MKGFAIRGTLKYIKEKTPGRTKEVISQLPFEVQKYFGIPIITSQWYPYEVFSSLLRETDRVIGNGDLRLCIDMGDFAARQDINGIFKMMLSLMTPDTLLKRSGIFWSKYCDEGTLTSVGTSEFSYTVKLEKFPTMDEAHCNLMLGWMTRLGLISRASTMNMKHTVCVNHGGALCQWEGTWRPD